MLARTGLSHLLITAAAGFGLASLAAADGSEMLGDPSIAIANGSQVLAAGIGLENAQPGNIDLDVPAGLTVEQVLLYWNGFSANAVGLDATDTIDVSGNAVVGTRIGGPDELGFDMNFSAT
jgi:hypothetical protein